MELRLVALWSAGVTSKNSIVQHLWMRRHLNEGILATARDSTCACPTCIVQGALQTCV